MSTIKGLNFVLILCAFIGSNLSWGNAVPLFFYNPFATPKMNDGDIENVSIYTTTEHSVEDQISTESPSIYYQIVRNVFERISSPVVTQFSGLGDSTEKSGKIISTTSRTMALNESLLEILDDPLMMLKNATNGTEVEEIEYDDREFVNPKLMQSNPSFADHPGGPERLVVDPDLKTVHDGDNEIESRDRVDDVEVADHFFDDSTEQEDDDVETTTESIGKEKTMVEGGLIMLIEYVASIITLTWSAIMASFRTRS